MVGITLSAEQIRAAPPEVRRWLEREMLTSFGVEPSDVEAKSNQLTGLTVEEATRVLSLIQGLIPVTNVFFELGREGTSVGVEGIEAFRLADILRMTRLQNLSQVVRCLDVINQAAAHVRGDNDVLVCGVGDQGLCFIAAQTQHSILQVWRQLVADRNLEQPAGKAEGPLRLSFDLPPSRPVPISPVTGEVLADANSGLRNGSMGTS
jgi:hypothetical protein